MNWSCPHCLKEQLFNKPELTARWSLMKCLDCECFSLIKKNQIKPLIIPGKRRSNIQSNLHLEEKNQPKAEDIKTFALPNPLPQIPELPRMSRQLIPMFVGASLTAILFLGGLIFFQEKTIIFIPKETKKIQLSNKKPLLFDKVTTQAMAPSKRIQQSETHSTTKKIIQLNHIVTPNQKNTKVRVGPSTQHQIITPVQPGLKFTIKGFKDNWLKVSSIKKHSKTDERLVGWIRSDLLEKIQDQK